MYVQFFAQKYPKDQVLYVEIRSFTRKLSKRRIFKDAEYAQKIGFHRVTGSRARVLLIQMDGDTVLSSLS